MYEKFVCLFGVYSGRVQSRLIVIAVRDFLDQPETSHRPAEFYWDFSGLNKDICCSLKTLWQRDLECVLNEKEWKRIVANSWKYIRVLLHPL